MEALKPILYAVKKGGHFLPKEYGWYYCVENNIPQLLVYPKIKFARISWDLLSIDFGLRIKDENHFAQNLLKYYRNYAKESNLPDNQFTYAGAFFNGTFIIWKKDYLEIVNFLITLIDETVKTHGYFDQEKSDQYETNYLRIHMQDPNTTMRADKIISRLKELSKRSEYAAGQLKGLSGFDD